MRLITIGRSPDNDVHIDDATVSRRHAELVVTNDGQYYLSDCNSTVGTCVAAPGGAIAIRQRFVQRDDQLTFGDVEVSLREILSTAR